jgi:hypothetical protein
LRRTRRRTRKRGTCCRRRTNPLRKALSPGISGRLSVVLSAYRPHLPVGKKKGRLPADWHGPFQPPPGLVDGFGLKGRPYPNVLSGIHPRDLVPRSFRKRKNLACHRLCDLRNYLRAGPVGCQDVIGKASVPDSGSPLPDACPE